MENFITLIAYWAQILSLPVAIIAIIASYIFFRRSRQNSSLVCVLDDAISPIEIKAGAALQGDIEIRYKGEIVDNLLVLRATIKNTGNVPILKSHVVEPVSFVFDTNAELLREPAIIATKPENLKAEWSLQKITPDEKPNVAALDFELLNPGEELSTEFVYKGGKTLPKITARIQGISRDGS